MSIDERKRQKQLAKKKKKRQEKRSSIAATPRTNKSPISASQQEAIANAPLHECLIPQELFENGIGTVMIARKLGDNEVLVGGFLLDVFCLGVKNAFLRSFTLHDYQTSIAAGGHETQIPSNPATTRKLIESCVEYARGIGFEPHSDYQTAKLIFGDIDPTESAETYTFGSEGKPLFIAGPNDNAKACKRVLATLEKHCGPDGFQSFAALPSL